MRKGFTLIETLVAVSLLAVAIVAPMSLTSKSLAAAYYARDQVTAFSLAQEAIESVRHVRDHNILETALGNPTNLLSGFPSTTGDPFIIDAVNDAMTPCDETCPPLRTNGLLYSYGTGPEWEDTRFTRTVHAVFVGESQDEIRIEVEVEWLAGAFQTRSVTITENLYRWVNDGSATE